MCATSCHRPRRSGSSAPPSLQCVPNLAHRNLVPLGASLIKSDVLWQGLMSQDDVHAELGQVINGTKPGRETEDEIIVCDLTGTGAQDAAIGGVAWGLMSSV